MTLIDKAEALLPCPFCGGEARYQANHTTECRDSVWCWACDFGMFDPDEQGSVVAAWNRRALPARGVGVRVRKLVWEPSAINKPWHSARCPWGWYYAQWDDEIGAWFASLEMGEVEHPIILQPSDVTTLEAAKAAAEADYEARILAALSLAPAPTDAAHVNETPKSEHDAGNVLTAAQAREAALREAASVIQHWWADSSDNREPAPLILALLSEART